MAHAEDEVAAWTSFMVRGSADAVPHEGDVIPKAHDAASKKGMPALSRDVVVTA
jgi:hypothetical protein